MATGDLVRELREELTCPMCLEYFRDPVTIATCGHSFCGECLTGCWRGRRLSCLLCKEAAEPRNVRPNRQLANMVKIAKKLSLQRRQAEEGICERHREPLELFCPTDEILICRVCGRSEEHGSHEAIPADEAAQDYKDKIFNCLETLRTKKENILVYIEELGDKSREMLKITETEREKTVAEFGTLRQWLKEQEKRLLAQIEEVEKEVTRKWDDQQANCTKELSSLERLIREMEEKHHQSGSKVLQDIRSSLQRYKERENFEIPVAFSSDLKWRLQGCCDIVPFLGGIMKQFKDALLSDLRTQKANVTLGPTPADSKLILSEDRSSIQCHSQAQDQPEDPENVFDHSYVLGSEGFTSGCHFWEVTVGNEDGWAVGVARKPVKATFIFTPEEGIWAVGRWKLLYKAFIRGIDPLLTVREGLKRIRVSLNYEGGQVAFFDADNAALLYKFTGASFSGETLRPFFAVYGKGCLRLCP